LTQRSVHVGVGLWNFRSTARRPAAMQSLYRRGIDDARLVESLGFDSLWLGGHRFWYDGWCPQPVLAASALLAATHRLSIGTAVHLLPQHDPARAAATVRSLEHLFPGRLELGIGLGYRAEEYDGLGLALEERVPRLETGLTALGAHGFDARPWLGGMAEAAVRRGGRHGLSLLLPPGVEPAKLERLVGLAREAAASAGTVVPRVGILKDVWVAEDGDAARAFAQARLRHHYREYTRAWWARDDAGCVDPARAERQLERNLSSVIAGTPEEVAARLHDFVGLGVNTVVLQNVFEETTDERDGQLHLLAGRLLPLLREMKAA
jgi:alkanesulfonate monooxygenase SsuD/methylene tetrahydromethanopterin reductase-like flavin-dependent oxidoreductase (luciferase family)